METKTALVSSLEDINIPISRPYLVRAISTNPDIKKTHARTVLECLKSMRFSGNFEVMQNFDIIVRCTHDVISRLEAGFKGQIECLPVEFLDDTNKH